MSGGVDQNENPDRIACDLRDEAIASVRRKLARSGHLALVSEHWKLGQSRHCLAKQAVHSERSVGIAGFKLVPDRRTVLLGFRRP